MVEEELKDIKIEINNRLKLHLNQFQQNKDRKKTVDDEIREISMQLFHFIFKQQIKLIRKTSNIENNLALNLNNLIKKENALLNKIEYTFSDYDDILTDYNELESCYNNLKIDFNFKFKKNEIIENYLIIGNLLVIFFRIFFFFNFYQNNILILNRILMM